MITIRFRRLENGHDLPLPSYAKPGDAGMDVMAAIASEIMVSPGRLPVMIGIGFAMEIPFGFEAQVRPRSGLAIKHGITVANSPGTIDSQYTGEVMVGLVNLGSAPYIVKRGDRIAQLVIAPVVSARPVEADELSKTERGMSGIGSTGR